MPRDFVSIHVGQAGVQTGNTCWQLYCQEHGLDEIGKKTSEENAQNDSLGCFFNESPIRPGKFSPRAIFIDSEQTAVDSIRSSAARHLYNPKWFTTEIEDAAHNFARGYFQMKTLLDKSVDSIMQIAEECDKLQGLFFNFSFSGGTGSGFFSKLAENLSDQLGKVPNIAVAIFPSLRLSNAVVEPYNAVLAAYKTMENLNCVFLVDNKSLYNSCEIKLNMETPNYASLNKLLARQVSSITSSVRFSGPLNANFTDFQTNLVPYPRIHFPVMSYAPIVSAKATSNNLFSVADITCDCFDPSSCMLDCGKQEGLLISCCLLYRGDIAFQDVNTAISNLKRKKFIRFANWSPTGFKVAVSNKEPTHFDPDMARSTRALCVLSNTTSLKNVWSSIGENFRKMFLSKAFLHWYTQEGLEEATFSNAFENLTNLVSEYDAIEENQLINRPGNVQNAR